MHMSVRVCVHKYVCVFVAVTYKVLNYSLY